MSDEKTPNVLRTLQQAAKGLLFPSESDKPVKAFVWQNASGDADEKALRASVKLPPEAKIKPLSVTEFFEPVADDPGFRDLIATLQKNLSDVKAFRVEGAQADQSKVDVYVVGKTADGDLAGVSTQLVET